MNIGGRGGAGYTMMLPIEQKWQVETYSFSYPDCWNDGGCGTVTETHYYPDPEWWDLLKPGYGPGVMHVRRGQWLKNNCNTPSGSPPRARFTLTRLTFTLPDGTEYDFVDQLTGGQKTILSTCATSGTNRGTVFVTTDGTAATFISDTNIYDDYLAGESWNSNDVAGYLIMRDGTRYRIDAGQVTWLRDRNGNKVTFTNSGIGVTTITDSLNRQITVEYNVNEGGQYGVCDRITYKGFGGANRVLRVSKTALGNVLRAGSSLQTYAYLFPGLEGSLYDYFNPTVVSDVWLPDNRRYQFRYNSYGELARVVLPTGGAVEYDHAAGLSDTANPGGVIDNGSTKNIYRRVLERREYPDGVNLSQKMTYSRWEGSGSGTGAVTVEQLDAGGVRLTKQKHYFHGNGADQSLFGHTPVGYPAWDEGREYQTEVFDTNGTTILRRTNNTWQGNGTLGGRTVNPRVVESGGTLEPAGANLVAKQTFAHDAYNNQTDVYEYDYGTGVAGALVRRTHTDYLTANPVNGSNYATDNNIHIRSLPAQSSVYDAGGTEVARATYEYDNYASDAYHTALTDRANLSGFDAAFNVSYTTRGNPTKASQWLLPAGTAISAYSQYDIAGNVVKTIDPKGHAANIYYDDNFGAPNGEAQTNTAPLELSSAGQTSYGFPTRAVNALGHMAYTQFDYHLGRPVEGEDANGVIANGAYNDPLDRPTQAVAAVNKPNKSQVSFAYDDANRLITTTGDLTNYNDNALKKQVLYDQLGRAVEARAYETSATYITAKTNYDALGRVTQASNPYRAGETVVWTTSVYDALGRVTSITTPDNAVVSTSYSGNTVTVSDQNGKQRKSVTDALGRLTQVYEDPAGLNYLTSYTYDVLGNLRQVDQGGQMRYFSYDSLSRLLRAHNPEQNVNTGLNLTDAVTGHSQWTMGYTYDDNSNLLTRTDARGVVTTYAYDALNRNTTATYSDGVTPQVTRFYDGVTNGVGRLWKTETANTARTQVSGFDEYGRPLSQTQQFWLNSAWTAGYTTTPTFNLAGGMTAETYPSGHIVNYGYDTAGRLSSFTGNLGDGTTRTYATGLAYSPFGGLTQEQYGTQAAVYNKSFYNSRGQLSEIRVSTTPNDTSWNRGAIINHYSLQSWAGSGTDNNGNLKKQEVYIPHDDQISNYTAWGQAYDYDSLNRLQRVHEYNASLQTLWQQEYVYDRWGNRLIHQTNTWGNGIPKPNFGCNTATNQLTAPAGSTMTYNEVGNLTYDNFTGQGARNYDGENRMTSAWGNNQWQYYTYNGEGQRISRQANGVKTWQVYGVGGELLAEYAENGAANAPQKEYGYRGGQLLVTAENNSNNDNVQWLVADHLGTPRMIVDRTGSLSGVKRVDNLPFGEELAAGTGLRANGLGYNANNVRQGFTGYEEDGETGLDYAKARYMSAAQGRFISVDPLLASATPINPKTWNRFAYALNNPLRYIDPTGLLSQEDKKPPQDPPPPPPPQPPPPPPPAPPPNLPKLTPDLLPAPKQRTFGSKEADKAAQKEFDKVLQLVDLVYYIYHSPIAPFINGNITFGEDGNGKVVAKKIPITNAQKAAEALKNAPEQFSVNSVFGTHADEVGPGALSFRSYTVGDNRLGSQSLQINVGPGGVRADLDPSNPDQDLAGFTVHTAPRAGNILKRFFRKIF